MHVSSNSHTHLTEQLSSGSGQLEQSGTRRDHHQMTEGRGGKGNETSRIEGGGWGGHGSDVQSQKLREEGQTEFKSLNVTLKLLVAV